MKFTELKQHLSSEELLPAYALFGNDRYLMTHAKKLFCDLVTFPMLNVNAFESSADPYEILKACTTVPMMDKLRLVVVDGVKSLEPILLEYLKNPSPDTILLFFPSVAPTQSTFSKHVEFLKCDHLDTAMLTGWIKKQAKERITSDASDLLIGYTMSDLTRIETELSKLLIYVGEDGVVSKEMVEQLVTADAEYKIYELTQAIGEGNSDRAYAMADNMLRSADPLVLMKAISNYFHKLLHVRIARVSEEEIAASFHVSSPSLRYTRAQAKRFSPLKLKSISDYIAESDYRVKTGGMTSLAALDNIMLRIFAAKDK